MIPSIPLTLGFRCHPIWLCNAPLTDRTPPVGILPPPNYCSENLDFTAFEGAEELPSCTENPWGIFAAKAGRSWLIKAKTGRNVRHWNHRHSRRKMGEEPEPPDQIPSSSHH